MSLQDHRDLIDDLVRDANGRVTPEARDRALALAVTRYSTDRPREVLAEVTSTGGQALATPAGWVVGDSVLRAVEFPIDLAPPTFLESSDYAVYRRMAGEIVFLQTSLTAGDVVRLTYTQPHQVDASADTVPAEHAEAVAHYAAAHLCDQLSTLHADDSAPTIGADRMDQSNPARQWASRARAYRERYAEILGIPKDTGRGGYVPPAGAVTNIDPPSSRGRGHLFKRR